MLIRLSDEKIEAYLPWFYIIQEGNSDYAVRFRVYAHLKSTKNYADILKDEEDYQTALKEHNSRVAEIVIETQRTADLCITRYPMLQERVQDRENPSTYYTSKEDIVRIIQTQSSLMVENSDIAIKNPEGGAANSIAHIENRLIRNLFLGELRAAILQEQPSINQIDSDFSKTKTPLEHFKTGIEKIIERIEIEKRLDGECSFENPS